MGNFEWQPILANLVAMTVLLGVLWRVLKTQTAALVREQAPSREEMITLQRRIDAVENTQKEFTVIKVELKNVETRVSEVKMEVRDTKDQLSAEITGAMQGVRDTIDQNNNLMIQLMDAKTGKRP